MGILRNTDFPEFWVLRLDSSIASLPRLRLGRNHSSSGPSPPTLLIIRKQGKGSQEISVATIRYDKGSDIPTNASAGGTIKAIRKPLLWDHVSLIFFFDTYFCLLASILMYAFGFGGISWCLK